MTPNGVAAATASASSSDSIAERHDAHAIYRTRLAERRRVVELQRRAERNFSGARLVVFLTGAALLVPALFWETLHWGWLALPVAAFAVLLRAHESAIRRRERAERACVFYERGLARLEDRWHGQGPAGEAFLDAGHPYAADLDIFGRGSLFELLCIARTRPGEERLAAWLLAPATPQEVRERQEAVRELSPRVDLREDLAVLGDDVRESVDPAGLVRWGAAPPALLPSWLVWVAAGLGILNVAAVLGFFLGQPLAILGALPGAVLAAALLGRSRRVLAAAERPEHDLMLLSEMLARLERERFRSRRLVRLRAVMDAEGAAPSARIARLARLVELNDSRRNMIFAPISGLLLFGTQLAFAMERWRRRSGQDVQRWLEALAEFEALSALAGFAWEHPADPFPEIVDEGPLLEGQGLAHPLLPADRAVPNDVHLGGDLRLLLVSGSNMSGKSTLLRTVGVNVVLGLAGAPVRARGLRLSPFAVGACMRVQDSLERGWSHFYAEIRRLRQVVDLAGGPLPLLFLLDEILHGTNSHDRRQGADALIRDLVARGASGLVTTHDLALCTIADDLGAAAANVHFADHLEGDRMVFDYALRAGVVTKSNALALMRAVGLLTPEGPE